MKVFGLGSELIVDGQPWVCTEFVFSALTGWQVCLSCCSQREQLSLEEVEHLLGV